MFHASWIALLCLAAACPALGRTEQEVCGTYRERWREELFLHRQARARALRQGRAVPLAAPVPPAARDIGEIAVLDDSDGTVARRNDFSLDGKTIAFLPDTPAAQAYRFQVTDGGFDTAAGPAGTPLAAMGDDDFLLKALPFPFPFFGNTYRQAYINSDGNLTFGAGDKASSQRSLARMAAGAPRIAPLFDDLDPSLTTDGVRLLAESGRVVITWLAVPEYDALNLGARQTFQVRLYPDGRIEFSYRGVDVDGAVVGIAPGNLQGGATNLVSFVSMPSGLYRAALLERFSGSLEVDIQTVAQKFYQTHDDAYDYLVVYNSLSIPASSSAVAWESTVRNVNRSGFGDEPLDIGREFGSASRLQAVLNLGPLSQYPKSTTGIVTARGSVGDTPLSIIGHEAGHLFLALASVREPDNPAARPMLRGTTAHWNFLFDSEASLLEGNRIRDDGSGASPRFTTTGTVEGYSPLDQYLMGLRPAEEATAAGPLFLVTAAPPFLSNRLPQTGVSFDGQRRDITVDEVIRAEGRRIPDHTVAQRRFRFAFILVTRQGTDPPADELEQVDAYRTQFEPYFRKVSSGRASADTSLRRALQLSLAPAAGVVEGRTATATVAIQKPAPAPLTVTLSAPDGMATAPASVTIGAGAASAAFSVAGIRAGVEEMTATASDPAYETAFARVQVLSPADLKLAVISGDGQLAGGGGMLPEPVILRLTDVNLLPYPGLRVRATASAGGSVDQSSAVTDADGRVGFRWTPGSAAAPRLQASVEGTGAGATVTAYGGTVIVLSVVNAASYAPAVAPGTLATVFGVGLAGGSQPALLVNGREVAANYAGEQQVNFVVPTDTAPGAAQLVIRNPRGSSQPASFNVVPAAPGIFFDPVTGAAGAVQRGGYLEIYCTGLGVPAAAPRVWIGSTEAPVVYAGAVPGLPGVNQVNVRIPGGLAGSAILRMASAGVESNHVRVDLR